MNGKIVTEDKKGNAVEVNAAGGKGSVTYGAFHKGIPARGIIEVARVVSEGAAKYDVNNWRLVTADEHVNHALLHLFEMLDPMGKVEEDHLVHAACRLLMAVDVAAQGGWKPGTQVPLEGTSMPVAASRISTGTLRVNGGFGILSSLNLAPLDNALSGQLK